MNCKKAMFKSAFRMRPFAGMCAALMFVSCQANTIDWLDFNSTKPTLGEIVYECLHQNIGRSSECSHAKVESLERRKPQFVSTFDYVVTDGIANDLPDVIGGTLVPFVDSGRLPQLTNSLSDVLQLLVSDDLDPDRKSLSALLNLMRTPTVLTVRDTAEVADSMLSDADLKPWLAQLTLLAKENDGIQSAAASSMDVLSRLLNRMAQPSMCTGISQINLDQTLLRTDNIVEDLHFGTPAWMVRADVHGNPKVVIDPITHKVIFPFVDANNDGYADVDAKGKPVDSDGAPIHMPPFGAKGWRDQDGRALAHNSKPLYVYYDAKRTGLGLATAFLSEGIDQGVHHDLLTLLDAVSGIEEACEDGTGNCWHFPINDNPMADLSYAMMEMARFDNVNVFLETWTSLLYKHPDVAQSVIVAFGDIVNAAQAGGVRLTDTDLLDLGREFLPLLADVFRVQNSSGASTPRLLMRVLHDLGTRGREFPHQLELTIDYSKLHKDRSCTSSDPNLGRSKPVDFSKPRYYRDNNNNKIDNRSGLEQVIELFSVVDCGTVPFTGGKSLGYFMVEKLASSDPHSVCNFIDGTLSAINTFPGASEYLGTAALSMMGCRGDRVWDSLQALDTLAKSGALDTFLPIANVFVEQHQTRTLIDIFHLATDDLKRDEDSDQSTNSRMRRLLPVLSQVLKTGAMDSFFDLSDILVTVPAVDGSGTMADVVVDTLARVVDDNGSINTRHGSVDHSSIALEMLTSLRTMALRLEASGHVDSLQHLIDFVMAYLQAEPGTRQLADKRLLPFAEDMLRYLQQLAALDTPERDCHLREVQNTLNEILEGREFATLVRLGRLIEQFPGTPILEQFVYRLLSPVGVMEKTDLHTPIIRVVAGILPAPTSAADFRELARFASYATDPARFDSAMLLDTLNGIVQADERDVFMRILRNAMYVSQHSDAKPPVSVLTKIVTDSTSVNPALACTLDDDAQWELSQAEKAINSTAEFLRDDQFGLGAIYTLIGLRTMSSP